MRVLVTGGTGFIGSYLVEKLVKEGIDVIVFDQMLDTSVLSEVKGKYKLITGDLASPPDVFSLVLENKVTDIFHLASLLAGTCEKRPFAGLNVNLKGTLNLLEVARIGKVKKFVFVSSISVFGKDALEPVDDEAPKNPSTIYGITKLASEHLCRWYNNKHNLDIRAVRFPWVFGPGRKRGITALYSSLPLDRIARGQTVQIRNPDERGDWLYIKDAVKALWLVWKSSCPRRRIYNISGEVHSIREVMETAKTVMPDAVIRYDDTKTSLSPYPSSYNDEWARKELGWAPSFSMEEAVRDHIQSVRNQAGN